ncbi:hypothetical protein [Flavobacterium johnsoniae]|uniref:Uncharacterized protein n=1 Tax=Flavobacterium johnsoniae TaxID=986 RepID=A0A1J7CFX8_FLAJO|nr:hypothetical protein [Flavobacterium johnsoniae]OIV40448.1 hypothetical protein BKM63_16295 [Flavobacterium johnsoniae]
MGNKFIFIVLTFFCLLTGQFTFAQDYNGGNGGSPMDDPGYLWNLGWLNEVCVGSGCNMNHLDNVNVQNNFTEDYIYLWNVLHSFEAYDYDFSSGGSGAADAEELLHQIEENPQFFLWFKDQDTDAFHSAVAITKEDISPGINDPVDYWYLGTSMGKDCDDTYYNLANQCSPNFIITDGNNPNRVATNGKALVMVKKDSDRTANISLAFDKFTPAIGSNYPIWSGTGITSNGISASYSGSSTSNFNMKITQALSTSGKIEIVNEGKANFSAQINEIKEKINDVSDVFRNFVEAKGTKVTEGQKALDFTGTIERWNVDMLNDGTRTGKATSIDLKGTYTMTMPKIKIPIYETGIAHLYATIDLGTGTGSANIKGIFDDSTEATAEFEGGFELGFTAFSGGVSAVIGDEDKLCAAATGTVNIGYFKVGGTLLANNLGRVILLTPHLKIGEVGADYSLSVKVNIGTLEEKCEIVAGSFPIWNEQDIPFSPWIIYSTE